MDDISSELDVAADLLTRRGELGGVGSPASWLADQVAASRTDEVGLSQWTSSTVVDDNVQAPVFDEVTFDWLHRGTSTGAEFPIGHAGLMHTYGYLLSTVATPYGLKRERWLTTDLAMALGEPPTQFYPTASTVPLMERVSTAVLPVLTDPAGIGRTVLAFDEVVDDGHRVRTVFVADPRSRTTAVVYGAITGSSVRLVTTFPFGPLTSDWVTRRLAEPARYRFNYAPPGASPGSVFDGHTEIILAF